MPTILNIAMCSLQHAIITEAQWSYEINGGTLITLHL